MPTPEQIARSMNESERDVIGSFVLSGEMFLVWTIPFDASIKTSEQIRDALDSILDRAEQMNPTGSLALTPSKLKSYLSDRIFIQDWDDLIHHAIDHDTGHLTITTTKLGDIILMRRLKY